MSQILEVTVIYNASFGGKEETRTLNPLLLRQVCLPIASLSHIYKRIKTITESISLLYQLSYSSAKAHFRRRFVHTVIRKGDLYEEEYLGRRGEI